MLPQKSSTSRDSDVSCLPDSLMKPSAHQVFLLHSHVSSLSTLLCTMSAGCYALLVS